MSEEVRNMSNGEIGSLPVISGTLCYFLRLENQYIPFVKVLMTDLSDCTVVFQWWEGTNFNFFFFFSLLPNSNTISTNASLHTYYITSASALLKFYLTGYSNDDLYLLTQFSRSMIIAQAIQASQTTNLMVCGVILASRGDDNIKKVWTPFLTNRSLFRHQLYLLYSLLFSKYELPSRISFFSNIFLCVAQM